MTDTDAYSTAPAPPPKRGWPISAWILPDVLIGFVLTVVLTLIVVAALIFLFVFYMAKLYRDDFDGYSSTININNYPAFQTLNLYLKQQSNLNIRLGIQAGSVDGSISKDSYINATAGEAHKFLRLINP